MQQFCNTLCLHDAGIVSIDVSGGGNGDIERRSLSLAFDRTTD